MNNLSKLLLPMGSWPGVELQLQVSSSSGCTSRHMGSSQCHCCAPRPYNLLLPNREAVVAVTNFNANPATVVV